MERTQGDQGPHARAGVFFARRGPGEAVVPDLEELEPGLADLLDMDTPDPLPAPALPPERSRPEPSPPDPSRPEPSGGTILRGLHRIEATDIVHEPFAVAPLERPVVRVTAAQLAPDVFARHVAATVAAAPVVDPERAPSSETEPVLTALLVEPLGPPPCGGTPPSGSMACVEPAPEPTTRAALPLARWAGWAALTVVAVGTLVGVMLMIPEGRAGEDVTTESTVSTVMPADAPDHRTFVAEAALPLVDIHATPGGARPVRSLEHPVATGGPLMFVVTRQQGDWLEVRLPTSPPGSLGWVHADQVAVSSHDYRIVLRLEGRVLDLFERGSLEGSFAVSVGRQDAPPPGDYFVKELLRPPSGNARYGEFVFGLSGYPTALDGFTHGSGVVGIHGSGDPAAVVDGTAGGSIALTDEAMARLVGRLPLGTPVAVRP
jgi:hypothetical protein